MAKAKPSRTAEVVAAERALLDDMGIIDDPLATSMLGTTVAGLYRMVRRWPRAVPTLPVTLAGLAARVRWHDDQVKDAVASGIDQVAVVGAGYDSRAWRMAVPGVRFFELDDPVTQMEKVRRAPGSGPTYVAADLAVTTAADALASAGLEFGRPAIFVLEGLTMYLSRDDVRSQLAALAQTAADGSVLTTDFYPPGDAGTAAHRRQNRVQAMARTGGGETFGLLVGRDEAVTLVEEAGWRVEHVAGARDAAESLEIPHARLPVSEVNNDKTLLAATLTQRAPSVPTPGRRSPEGR